MPTAAKRLKKNIQRGGVYENKDKFGLWVDAEAWDKEKQRRQYQVDKLLNTLPGINHPNDTNNNDFVIAAATARQVLETLVNSREQYRHLNIIFHYIYIHTKGELLDELRRGVAWLEPHLKVSDYVILTERDVFDLTERSKHFKSAEWIARLALDKTLGMPELKLPAHICTIDEHFNKPYNTYVIFDDGLYSGRQKASSIWTVIRNKQNIRLFLLAPFYTDQSIQQINSTIMRMNIQGNSYNDFQQYYYEDCVLWKSINLNVQVYVWTGGKKMQCTGDIVNYYYPSKCDSVMQVLSRLAYDPSRGGIYEDTVGFGVGATLTLFQHKIPDTVSLVRVIEEFFRDNMRSYYEWNPPYKRVNIPLTGGRSRVRRRLPSLIKGGREVLHYSPQLPVLIHSPTKINTPLTDSSFHDFLNKHMFTECEKKLLTTLTPGAKDWFQRLLKYKNNSSLSEKQAKPEEITDQISKENMNGYITSYCMVADILKEKNGALTYDNDGIYMLFQEIITREEIRSQRKSGGTKNIRKSSVTKKMLEGLTVRELQQHCSKRKIKYSGLRKSELIDALLFSV